MANFSNSGLDKFLASIPTASLDNADDKLTVKCKFNFAYLCSDPAGQDIDEWSEDEVKRLLIHFRDFSKEPLIYWRNQRSGPKKSRVLDIYGEFPSNSKFNRPLHVPHQALWGRFRLTTASRVIGFIIPDSYKTQYHSETKVMFDCNTFYVVFLDKHHRFAPKEQK